MADIISTDDYDRQIIALYQLTFKASAIKYGSDGLTLAHGIPTTTATNPITQNKIPSVNNFVGALTTQINNKTNKVIEISDIVAAIQPFLHSLARLRKFIKYAYSCNNLKMTLTTANVGFGYLNSDTYWDNTKEYINGTDHVLVNKQNYKIDFPQQDTRVGNNNQTEKIMLVALDKYFNDIMEAFIQDANKFTVIYTSGSCHSNCHSSCHDNRGRR